jgi:hypothetical protein
MWMILLLLWLLPLSLVIVLVGRSAGGIPVVSKKEWRFLFGDTRNLRLSIWMIPTFVVVAVLFFFAGVVEGLVLTNLGTMPLVLVPLFTGLAATVFSVLWLRTGAREKPLRHHRTALSGTLTRHARYPHVLKR